MFVDQCPPQLKHKNQISCKDRHVRAWKLMCTQANRHVFLTVVKRNYFEGFNPDKEWTIWNLGSWRGWKLPQKFLQGKFSKKILAGSPPYNNNSSIWKKNLQQTTKKICVFPVGGMDQLIKNNEALGSRSKECWPKCFSVRGMVKMKYKFSFVLFSKTAIFIITAVIRNAFAISRSVTSGWKGKLSCWHV